MPSDFISACKACLFSSCRYPSARSGFPAINGNGVTARSPVISLFPCWSRNTRISGADGALERQTTEKDDGVTSTTLTSWILSWAKAVPPFSKKLARDTSAIRVDLMVLIGSSYLVIVRRPGSPPLFSALSPPASMAILRIPAARSWRAIFSDKPSLSSIRT